MLTCKATPCLQVVKRSRDLFFEFWEHLHISGTAGARNFKFGMQIDYEGFLRKEIKIRSEGVGKESRDLLLKFWDPSISWEQLELETSNLACKGFLRKEIKIRSKGVGTLTFGDVLLGNIIFFDFSCFWCVTHCVTVAVDICVNCSILYLSTCNTVWAREVHCFWKKWMFTELSSTITLTQHCLLTLCFMPLYFSTLAYQFSVVCLFSFRFIGYIYRAVYPAVTATTAHYCLALSAGCCSIFSELTFMFARCYRPSVCLSSVTLRLNRRGLAKYSDFWSFHGYIVRFCAITNNVYTLLSN